jgi:hypothetical protein
VHDKDARTNHARNYIAVIQYLHSTTKKNIISYLRIRGDIDQHTTDAYLFHTDKNGNLKVTDKCIPPTSTNSVEQSNAKEDTTNIIELGGPNTNYIFGPFENIYSPIDENEDIAQNCKSIISALENNNPVFIIGYGSSGAGKTSTLIYLEDTVGEIRKEQDGILIELLKQLEGINSIVLDIDEFYYKDEDKPNRINGITFIKNIKGFHNDEHGGLSKYIRDNIDTFEARKIAPTTNNKRSSRSHVIVTLKLINENSTENYLFIADYAGVEMAFPCKTMEELIELSLLRSRDDKEYVYNHYDINKFLFCTEDNFKNNGEDNEDAKYKFTPEKTSTILHFKGDDNESIKKELTLQLKNNEVVVVVDSMQNIEDIIDKITKELMITTNTSSSLYKLYNSIYIDDNWNHFISIYNQIMTSLVSSEYATVQKLIKYQNIIDQYQTKYNIKDVFSTESEKIQVEVLRNMNDYINLLTINNLANESVNTTTEKSKQVTVTSLINASNKLMGGYEIAYTKHSSTKFIFVETNSGKLRIKGESTISWYKLPLFKFDQKTNFDETTITTNKKIMHYIKWCAHHVYKLYQICDCRSTEGKFINDKINDMRQDIYEIISMQNRDVLRPTNVTNLTLCSDQLRPLYIDDVISSKYTTKQNTILKQHVLSKIKDDYKNLVLCFFCIFNASKELKKRPPIPYININPLKYLVKYIKMKDDSDDNGNDATARKLIMSIYDVDSTLVSNYIENQVKIFAKYIPQNILANINRHFEYYNTHKTVTAAEVLMKYIQSYNNTTPLGTLEFVDHIMNYTNANDLSCSSTRGLTHPSGMILNSLDFSSINKDL